MEVALLRNDFSLQYVADNGSRSTPLLYKIASAWSALEGSILLWVLVLARLPRRADPALPRATATTPSSGGRSW